MPERELDTRGGVPRSEPSGSEDSGRGFGRFRGRITRAFLLLATAHTAVYAVVVGLALASGPAFQVEIFRDYAQKIASGLTPYADFSHEYPPLSLFILILPRLLTENPTLYAALFGLEILLFDLAIMFVLSRVGLKSLVLYGVGMLLFWRAPFIRHDLVPVAVSTFGAFLLLRGRYLWSAFFWGIGGALKLYPVVAVPALGFGASVRQTLGRWILAGVVFVVGVGWGIVAFGPKTLMFLTYHSDRPAQVESLAGNIQLLLPDPRIINSFGSFNVTGPASEPLLFSFEVLQLLLVLLGLGVAFFQSRDRSEAGMRRAAVRGAALATFAFAVFGKVFAWHYLFWPLPLIAMVQTLTGFRYPKATWGLYFAAIALTTAINEQYWSIDRALPYFITMLTVRNILVVALFGLLLLRPPAEDHTDERTESERDDGDV